MAADQAQAQDQPVEPVKLRPVANLGAGRSQCQGTVQQSRAFVRGQAFPALQAETVVAAASVRHWPAAEQAICPGEIVVHDQVKIGARTGWEIRNRP